MLLPLPLLGVFPLSHSSAVCVRLWRTDFPERKWKGLLAEESRRERTRSQGQCWGRQQPGLPAPSTDPASSQPAFTGLHKSTCRSHYCSPSSVFTATLEIVITLVRTEIFNLDVFLRVRYAAAAKGEVVRKRQMLAQRKRGGTAFGLRWEPGRQGRAL